MSRILNIKHRLIQQLENWNKWRKDNPDVMIDLRGANLSRANLSGADLSGADLSGADLSGADFCGTYFGIEILSRANLSGANLSRANLGGANLGEANLSGANLIRANLGGANLGEANLSGANLGGANLRRADLSGADLSRADLRRVGLRGADLRGANLREANLSGANLREADLSGANLSGADLNGANIHRTNFINAILEGVDCKSINLSRNQLKELPKEIGNLKNLTSINLSGNQLKELPKEIGNLKNLTTFDVSYNFLKFPPPEIIKQGMSATIEYLKKSFNKGKTLYEAKLIIVGQGGVGKTCLRKRLIENKYNEEENTTKGIDIQEWNIIDNTINNKMIKLNVWDFGGQEIYHATHQFFLTQRSLYILVWDSRQEEEYGRIDYWLNTIETFASDSPIFLIMNKADIRNKDLNIKDLKERHPQIISGKVSAKKNIGITNLKRFITIKALNLPLMGTFWPLSWIKVRKVIEETNLNYASYKNYLEVCKKINIEENEASILSRYLHDLGIVLHFHEDTLLKDIMIFKPEWGTNAVYKVLDAPQVQKQNGILYDENLSEIWSDKSLYPPDKYAIILRLMANFELAFPVSDRQQHVVAELLPIKEFEYDWHPKKCLQFEYHYEFLPTGIITRLIVRMYEYLIKEKDTYLCWREGAYFEYEGSKALIRMNFYARIAIIQIDGLKTREFLAIIRYHFDVIHKTIKKIKVKEKIPCICKIDCSYRFDYKVLLRRELKGFIDEYCGETDKQIKISSLLNGIENYENRIKKMKGNMEKSNKTVININNTQGDITIGTDQSKIKQYNSNKDFIEVLDQLKDELSKLTIDHNNREAIDIQLKTLEDNAKSDKKNPVLIKSTLESIKTITQGALGSAMGTGLVETFKRVGMFIV
ncbi:small GTP-binding protein domain protein [Candidatus Magnetomorum sp. HK-1]|nr:small GTP-binding protein domain protein [Candidatus Magnetomorum sp. HK-1]